MKKFITTALSACMIFILQSCSIDDSNPPSGDPTNPTSANITGSVLLFDEANNSLDNSGMLVTVAGLGLSALTDTDGGFTITNVPFGTYTITYEKTGYGTFAIYDLEHQTDGIPTSIETIPFLGQESTTVVTDLSSSIAGDNITITTSTSPAGSPSDTRYLRFFYSTSVSASNTNYDHVSGRIDSDGNPHNHVITTQDLIDMGFESGTTVYVRAYGDSFWSNSYVDPFFGFEVFPNININTVLATSFTVP
ncbi:MAG: carboxypeptidase-like regulatory domain-containing protein [Bacteroidota bacterium]